MKASKFNVFFTVELVQVGYNSYSNEFIILEPLLYDLYVVGSKKNDFIELKEIHPQFYDFLIQQGFLVDNDLDEFEMVKQHSIRIDNDDSLFHLTINPTMNCNFKCWYCYETHIKDSKMDEKTMRSVIKLVENAIQYQKGLKRILLTFFGGEPLLYFSKVIKPMLIEVSSLCKINNIEFSSGMTTNGLLIDQNMLDICKNNSLNSFQITLDGNRERHDKVRFISEGRGSYDKIVGNIKLAIENELQVNVRINCSAETMKDINEIIREFDDLPIDKRKFINFDLQKVWQEQERIEDSMSDTRFDFKGKGYKVSGTNPAEPILQSCYADKRYHAVINYNGEVFKCTARDFTNNSGEGILNEHGSIIWNEKYEKRLNSKFKNAPCRECRILPICAGGCTQAALESQGNDYCIMNFDEDAKVQRVKDKFNALVS